MWSCFCNVFDVLSGQTQATAVVWKEYSACPACCEGSHFGEKKWPVSAIVRSQCSVARLPLKRLYQVGSPDWTIKAQSVSFSQVLTSNPTSPGHLHTSLTLKKKQLIHLTSYFCYYFPFCSHICLSSDILTVNRPCSCSCWQIGSWFRLVEGRGLKCRKRFLPFRKNWKLSQPHPASQKTKEVFYEWLGKRWSNWPICTVSTIVITILKSCYSSQGSRGGLGILVVG